MVVKWSWVVALVIITPKNTWITYATTAKKVVEHARGLQSTFVSPTEYIWEVARPYSRLPPPKEVVQCPPTFAASKCQTRRLSTVLQQTVMAVPFYWDWNPHCVSVKEVDLQTTKLWKDLVVQFPVPNVIQYYSIKVPPLNTIMRV